jgi:HTH-type transcriptional regulator/antitoxin HigA
MEVRPLHTEEDHRWALAELEKLWECAQPGTPEGDRFEVLSTLVDSYEREHFPIEAADPIEAIRFRMEQERLSPRDLLAIFKTRGRVSEVMAKRRRLSLAMIRELHERLSIPIGSLIRNYPLRRRRLRSGATGSSTGRRGGKMRLSAEGRETIVRAAKKRWSKQNRRKKA